MVGVTLRIRQPDYGTFVSTFIPTSTIISSYVAGLFIAPIFRGSIISACSGIVSAYSGIIPSRRAIISTAGIRVLCGPVFWGVPSPRISRIQPRIVTGIRVLCGTRVLPGINAR